MKEVLLGQCNMFTKWHGKLDFAFQWNILREAISFISILEMYHVPHKSFQKNVDKWVQELENKFPNEPLCYALKAKLLMKKGASRGEIMSTLQKGLDLDSTNVDCFLLMEKHKVPFRFKDKIHVGN